MGHEFEGVRGGPVRKYLSEFGLNMVSGYLLLLQQERLSAIDDAGIEPHIYMIGRRPRIMLDPDSVRITESRVTGMFRKQIRDSVEEIPFDVPNLMGTKEVTMESSYPYTEYRTIREGGEVVGGGKCALLMASFGPSFWEHLDFEVLYVGQAYGTDGSRKAGDRLKRHETLQGIYSEAIGRNPDQEIWILVGTFEPLLLSSFDGITKNYATSEKEDSEHLSRVLSAEMTERQQINFTEAALIRYFQPEYNKIFKETFPNPAHSTYSECYDIDLNMVCVEMQTENIGLRLWSENIEPKWVHFAAFPLHSREERVYMFEWHGERAI